MPEMRFVIRWPDGAIESCYSPSLVIKDFFSPGLSYSLEDFVTSARDALTIASDRVAARYGFPCSRALGQLARIEAVAAQFGGAPEARVVVESFEE
ncbi:MAG TPA: MSMEG_0570 family nitrogen starvation response protein [Hansschlegelia sp.]